MITRENIKTWREWQLLMTPVYKSNDDKDKTPINKNGTWSTDWTDDELLNANRVGCYHKTLDEPKEQQLFDFDFDDKTRTANKFIGCLPPTFTVGKKINGKTVATHKIYKCSVKTKSYSYPKTAAKGGKVIELLTSTQTIFAGVDRIIINNVEPVYISDPTELKLHARLIAAFSELLPLIKDIQNRNDFYFRLGGALARETAIPMHLRTKYVEKLCELTNDPEVRNRVSCIERQQQNLDEGSEDVFGIKELSEFLGANLKAFDEIKKETEDDEEVKEKKVYKIQYANVDNFLMTNFPEPAYIIDPIVREQSITAVQGEPGVGKTMLGLRLAAGVACGCGFMSMPSVNGARPIFYMEGELPAYDIKTRINAIRKDFAKHNIEWKEDYFNIATVQQQNDFGFPPLHEEAGRAAVEKVIEEIAERTGKKVYVHLDNISSLCPGIKENDADAWSPLMHWMIKIKNKGHTVCYYHHLNKSGVSSGSTMQTRGIQMAIRLRKPDSKHRIPMTGEKAMQAVVDFPKWTLHDNSKIAQEHILTCDENQNWKRYPMLEENELKIIKYYEEGLTVKEMEEEMDIKEKTIYRKLKKLKDMEVIKDDKVS